MRQAYMGTVVNRHPINKRSHLKLHLQFLGLRYNSNRNFIEKEKLSI